MRKFIIGFLCLISLLGCNKTKGTDDSLTAFDEFSAFCNTKSTTPLFNTIWECKMNGEFNLYIWFETDTKVNVFWGKVDSGKLQCWMAFFEGTYKVDLENDVINMDVSFPNYGETEYINHIDFLKVKNSFRLSTENNTFNYFGNDSSSLDEIWVTIIADITPWN